ncbi:MAG: PQQ-dependent sugar dehydrogenase [Planctomycetota bacterium]
MTHLASRSLLLAIALPAAAIFSLDAEAQRVRRAPQTWVQYCQSCHGSTGGNGSASTLLDDAWTVGSGTDDDLFRAIHDGVPDAGMEAFGPALSNAEIRGLVVYIQELRDTHQRGLTPDDNGGSRFSGRKTYTSDHHDFVVEPIYQGLDRLWAMAVLPHGEWLINERDGDIKRARFNANGRLVVHPDPVAGTPEVRHMGQGGLLDIVLDPDYDNNGWIYLSYAEPRPLNANRTKGMTSIARGRVKDGRWVDEQVIWQAKDEHFLPTGQHFGSRIAFGPDGMLYFSIGDRGRMEQAQDLGLPNGKIHRIHPDGRIPEDNPFVNRRNAYPSIWAYGVRNPQGLDFHPTTGLLWESEHGPRGGDEINWIRKGLNYGWPVITYGVNYNGTPITDKTEAPGMEQPALYYVPSPAFIGIDHYTGDRFPNWRNDLFVSSIASGQVRRVRTDSSGKVLEDELLFQDQGGLRDIYDAPDGYLYVLTNAGQVLRIAPAD